MGRKLSFINRLVYFYTLFSSLTALYAADSTAIEEVALSDSPSFLSRVFDAGPIVSLVLLSLILMSITTWAISVSKWIYLNKIEKNCDLFEKFFWDSRSMNEMNEHLSKYPYSPLKELFRQTYEELLKGRNLPKDDISSEVAIGSTVDNLSRTQLKSKIKEKKHLEKHLNVLAISASACPFIGLFGTVWGIMNAFEGIARTGTSSLASVAPGISEALIATAFGLAAAIPAAIGYNISVSKIRSMIANMDGFSYDILNIVERFLISERSKLHSTSEEKAPRI